MSSWSKTENNERNPIPPHKSISLDYLSSVFRKCMTWCYRLITFNFHVLLMKFPVPCGAVLADTQPGVRGTAGLDDSSAPPLKAGAHITAALLLASIWNYTSTFPEGSAPAILRSLIWTYWNMINDSNLYLPWNNSKSTHRLMLEWRMKIFVSTFTVALLVISGVALAISQDYL